MEELYQRFRAAVMHRYEQLQNLVNWKRCPLTDKDLTEYQSFTFLSKNQIRKIYLLFHSLEDDIPEDDKNPALSHEQILKMDNIQLNPFNDRILKTFSSDEGVMAFEEFLEMMSVFSSKAPRKVKIEYAFRIYDFDEDDMIGTDDLKELLRRLLGGNVFTDDECDKIVMHIMEDGDIDGDGFITYPEFKHLLKKCPDFIHSFSIRV